MRHERTPPLLIPSQVSSAEPPDLPMRSLGDKDSQSVDIDVAPAGAAAGEQAELVGDALAPAGA